MGRSSGHCTDVLKVLTYLKYYTGKIKSGKRQKNAAVKVANAASDHLAKSQFCPLAAN